MLNFELLEFINKVGTIVEVTIHCQVSRGIAYTEEEEGGVAVRRRSRRGGRRWINPERSKNQRR